jgi:hypothetical protein
MPSPSMMIAPLLANNADTEDFPDPIAPVSPINFIRLQ